MLFIKDLRIFGWMFMTKIQSIKIPKEKTGGMSARIPHTTDFAIFLDYDNIDDDRLRDELVYLQELFEIGDFHVFVTNKYGRHAVCIDRLRLKEALDVVYESTCDAAFKRGIHHNEFRTWLLRVLEKGDRPKPKYGYSIESPYNGKNIQSQSHGEFLRNYYGASVRLTKPDGNQELEIQGYTTGNKTSIKDLKKP